MATSEIQQAEAVVQVDMGNLMAFDPRPLDSSKLKSNLSDYLSSLSKQGTQILLNSLFNLPVERVEDVIVATLPKCTTVLPREKPLPKPKPMTKWEQYAKMKGIHKTKKSRMAWDETAKEWRPRWGYNRKDDDTKDWIYEIKKSEDPYQDFFAKKNDAKKERTAKNELQRLRNIARTNSKGKVPGVGLQPLFPTKTDTADKVQLKRALNLAKKADASMSKFSKKLENEDKVTKGMGKKRKFDANFNIQSEKEKQFKILDKLGSTKDKSSKQKLNVEKAVNKHIASENGNGREHTKKRSAKGGKSGKKGSGGGFKKGGFKKGSEGGFKKGGFKKGGRSSKPPSNKYGKKK